MIPDWVYPPDYHRRSQNVLEKALRDVAAYQSWRQYDPGAHYPVDVRFHAMPTLSKADIRGHTPRGFVPVGCDVESGLSSGEISLVNSSGSTDDKVTNIWNQKWWDASERASWGLNSYASRLATGDHPEVILVNPLNVGIPSDELDLPMEKRRLSRFLYLNEKTDLSLWTPQLMERMVRELAIFKPAILEANPSYLAKFCHYVTETGQKVFQPGLIVLTYEYPTHFHYRQIQRVFTAPIASSYGTTETGYVFMECEAGKFHQNSEYCRVDFQPLKTEHGGPLLGRILVTTFNNPWYYILRFNVGDLVRIDENAKCDCGRTTGLILSATEGRIFNATLTCEGRLVTLRELDDKLDSLDDIDEYKMEQVSGDTYILHLVSRQEKKKLAANATSILKNLYGSEAKVTITFEDTIAPEKSGKYCLAQSSLPLKIEDYLDENFFVHERITK